MRGTVRLQRGGGAVLDYSPARNISHTARRRLLGPDVIASTVVQRALQEMFLRWEHADVVAVG